MLGHISTAVTQCCNAVHTPHWTAALLGCRHTIHAAVTRFQRPRRCRRRALPQQNHYATVALIQEQPTVSTCHTTSTTSTMYHRKHTTKWSIYQCHTNRNIIPTRGTSSFARLHTTSTSTSVKASKQLNTRMDAAAAITQSVPGPAAAAATFTSSTFTSVAATHVSMTASSTCHNMMGSSDQSTRQTLSKHALGLHTSSNVYSPCTTTAISTPRNGNFFITRHGERLDAVDPFWASRHRVSHTLDPPLTSTGKRQASKLGAYLSYVMHEEMHGARIDYIFSSPLLRTVQTSAQISKWIKAPVCLEWGLQESGTQLLPLMLANMDRQEHYQPPSSAVLLRDLNEHAAMHERDATAQEGARGAVMALPPHMRRISPDLLSHLPLCAVEDFNKLKNECPSIDESYESKFHMVPVESRAECQQRMHAVADYFAAEFADKNILFVSHYSPVRHMLASFVGPIGDEELIDRVNSRTASYCALSQVVIPPPRQLTRHWQDDFFDDVAAT
jgi:broad specificity phosphatase PhoE